MSTDLTVGKLYSGQIGLDPIPSSVQDFGTVQFYEYGVAGMTVALEDVFSDTAPTLMNATLARLSDIVGGSDRLEIFLRDLGDVPPDQEFRSYLEFGLSMEFPDSLTSDGILPRVLPIDQASAATVSVALEVREGDGRSIATSRGERRAQFELLTMTSIPVPPAAALLAGALLALGALRRRPA